MQTMEVPVLDLGASSTGVFTWEWFTRMSTYHVLSDLDVILQLKSSFFKKREGSPTPMEGGSERGCPHTPAGRTEKVLGWVGEKLAVNIPCLFTDFLPPTPVLCLVPGTVLRFGGINAYTISESFFFPQKQQQNWENNIKCKSKKWFTMRKEIVTHVKFYMTNTKNIQNFRKKCVLINGQTSLFRTFSLHFCLYTLCSPPHMTMILGAGWKRWSNIIFYRENGNGVFNRVDENLAFVIAS